MEEQSTSAAAVSGNKEVKSAKLLRYPLRSASKSKDSPSLATVSASASRRGKPTSTVSQSVSVLDISTKEKSAAKPPRRLSIPSKPSPSSKSVGYITPVSEARTTNRAGNINCKYDTPGSDVSRSLNRKKFTVLSSASYWLSHIKLSEVAGKHQLSLGFFKLALEASCENVQLLKDELKSYAGRYNLLDLGESAKEVLKSYDISETIEQLQVSETCSHMPEGTNSLEDDARSLSSVSKLRPKSSVSSASSAAKEATQKSTFVSKIKAPMTRNSVNKSHAVETGNNKIQKDSKKPTKQESNKEKQMVKTKGMKHADAKEQLDTDATEPVLEENKENENMDSPVVEEMSLEA